MAKEKHFLKIEVHTLPNGYSLDVDMYWLHVLQ